MTTRSILQLGFLALTVVSVFIVGADAERWCPFGGVEAVYTYAREGNMTCSLGVSNFYILGGVLLSTLLLRRAFCGYVCPVGAVSEWLRKGAAKLGIRAVRVPGGLDRALSLMKYPVLGVILYFTWRAGELVFRGYDPCYALISRHGEDITHWAYVISGAVVLASLFVMVPFCRWLCPLAAVLNPVSRFGLTRIRRNEEACVDCGKCGKACPMAIPVDQVREVTHARCTSCLDCLGTCPEKAGGALTWGLFCGGKAAPGVDAAPRPGLSRAALVCVLLAVIATSVSAAYLFPLPSFVWSRGEAPARTATASFAIEGLKCRGTANLLVYFLERDDDLELYGYVKLEAWPAPGRGEARITYDPAQADEEVLKMAITEPYFDLEADFWRDPPFKIEGYDPY